MTLLTQVVLLHWKDGDEEHKQELWNIQLDGSGRLKWAAVKEAFGADLVEIEDRGTPVLIEDGQWKGFTMGTFQPGSTILVTVSRKPQGENSATGQTVKKSCLAFIRPASAAEAGGTQGQQLQQYEHAPGRLY